MKHILILCSLIFSLFSFSFAQNLDSLAKGFPSGTKIMVLDPLQIQAKSDYEKGYALNNENKYLEATQYLIKAVTIDTSGNCGSGTDGLAYNELGYAYTRLNNLDTAIIYLNKSIQANTLNPKSYLNKATILMKQKKPQLAEATLEDLIKAKPDLAMAHAQLAYVYKANDKNEKALASFKKYLEVIKDQKQDEKSKSLILEVEKSIKDLEGK